MQVIYTETLDPASLTPDIAHLVYNGLDAAVTLDCYNNMISHLDAGGENRSAARRTYEFSKALQAPVLEMMLRGIKVDQVQRSKTLKEMRKKLTQLEAQLDQIILEGVGVSVNWRSPAQLGRLLYGVMGLPVQKKRNANGVYAPTTDREALEKLSVNFIAEPIINHLLCLRDLGKSIGFLETEIDTDGRMRSNFSIAGTDTGRWSSSVSDFGQGTNLQNVTESLRSIFVADPGMKFANLDLEQADARNVGALCWDLLIDNPDWSEADAGKYLDTCESGDLHTLVCKMSNPILPWDQGKTDREIADEIAYRHLTYRDLTKKLGHGSNFLGQPSTMAKHAKLPISTVKTFHENYFSAFRCIPAWHLATINQIKSHQPLTTLYGRRRFFFGRPTDAATHRKAIAFSPQSMTGDEINTGILALWRANRVQLLIQVHDSILFQYPEKLEDTIVPWALETLRSTIILKKGREFSVPTEAKTGWNWGNYSDGNPEGLKKYKGGDQRSREVKRKLSLSVLL